MKYLTTSFLILIFLIPIVQSVNAQQNSLTTNTNNSSIISTNPENRTVQLNQNNNNSTTTPTRETNENKVFRSSFDTFVNSKPEGYGFYDEKGSNVFKQGDSIILYIEPENFKYGTLTDEKNNTLYTMDFGADFLITDSQGKIIAGQQGIPINKLISHHQNKEVIIPFTITQDSSPIPQGNYTIKYTIHDGNSGNSFDIVKNITIS